MKQHERLGSSYARSMGEELQKRSENGFYSWQRMVVEQIGSIFNLELGIYKQITLEKQNEENIGKEFGDGVCRIVVGGRECAGGADRR